MAKKIHPINAEKKETVKFHFNQSLKRKKVFNENFYRRRFNQWIKEALIEICLLQNDDSDFLKNWMKKNILLSSKLLFEVFVLCMMFSLSRCQRWDSNPQSYNSESIILPLCCHISPIFPSNLKKITTFGFLSFAELRYKKQFFLKCNCCKSFFSQV